MKGSECKFVKYMEGADKRFIIPVYETVLARQAGIESALGTALIWDKGENKTSSKIYLRLPNISIENEVDWRQTAQFHSNWTKRFYDVIVPYVTGA